MSEHTPGPWSAGWGGDPDDEGKDEAGPINIVSFGRGGVASCEPIRTGHAKTWEIVEANACLIAAAPDLLEACRLAYAELWFDRSDTARILYAAISKAKGR